jgi:hypothetical protein
MEKTSPHIQSTVRVAMSVYRSWDSRPIFDYTSIVSVYCTPESVEPYNSHWLYANAYYIKVLVCWDC